MATTARHAAQADVNVGRVPDLYPERMAAAKEDSQDEGRKAEEQPEEHEEAQTPALDLTDDRPTGQGHLSPGFQAFVKRYNEIGEEEQLEREKRQRRREETAEYAGTSYTEEVDEDEDEDRQAEEEEEDYYEQRRLADPDYMDDAEDIELREEQENDEGEDEDEQRDEDADHDLQELAEPSSEDHRTEEELEVIRYEMLELESEIPISKQYRLVDRLGEGTFSSVYKAIDLSHPWYNNDRWREPSPRSASRPPLLMRASSSSQTSTSDRKRRGRSRSSSSGPSPYTQLLEARKYLKTQAKRDSDKETGNPVYVAIKRIYVTSSPQRIANELEILADLRNARNTAYLISATRHEDQVIAVMPYSKHQDFRTYFRTMTMSSIRNYFYSLFSALDDCHAKGIMHRDVKPANFLFNERTQTGTLCDFGLAQRFHPQEWVGRCLHSMPLTWKASSLRDGYAYPPVTEQDEMQSVHGLKLTKPADVLSQIEDSWDEFLERGTEKAKVIVFQNSYDRSGHLRTFREDGNPFVPELPWRPLERSKREMEKRVKKDDWAERWGPVMRHPKDQKIGYMKPEVDKRPPIRANRAGTRGFRAPEVVLKCPDQTMALDIWSVGVILLCILTRRFPFFTSNDDTEALMEIAAIFGKKRTEKCAALHNRTFLTNIPTLETPRFSTLHELVRSLNPNIFIECMPRSLRNGYSADPEVGMKIFNDSEYIKNFDHSAWYGEGAELFQAIDLLKRCLNMDLTKRTTARQALSHPFFSKANELI